MTHSETGPVTGGCLCGAIRFEADRPPRRVTHCHCETCRKSLGAVVATFATFERAAVTWHGTPARYVSSDIAWREFCPTCGTTLTYNHIHSPERVFVSLGSFDDPSAFPAQFHDFHHAKVSWLQVDEELPDSPH